MAWTFCYPKYRPLMTSCCVGTSTGVWSASLMRRTWRCTTCGRTPQRRWTSGSGCRTSLQRSGKFSWPQHQGTLFSGTLWGLGASWVGRLGWDDRVYRLCCWYEVTRTDLETDQAGTFPNQTSTHKNQAAFTLLLAQCTCFMCSACS